ncbi:MAG: DUF2961 domain-containing protein [Abitibacteriaceae bacterium]|nr:DUF2961 domain-containing protein [Abditibacteriaceae bacterium]
MRTVLALLLCLVAGNVAHAATPNAAPARLTYVDLVRRLTDLEGLATLPLPGEKTAQWSSYDRASVYDPATNKYVNWNANGDGGGIIRHEGDESVLAEMDGPGCIWRIWSATPGDGHVKIYLDGATEPTVDLPFKAYFDHRNAPFVYPALVHTTTANGWNSYVPVPYQKSCKIVADKGWGNYYQFTYTTFPANTVVPTFTRNLGVPEQAALAAADKFLSSGVGTDPATIYGGRRRERQVTQNLIVPVNRVAALADLRGARAITSLHVRVNPAALGEATDTLRQVVMSIRWDGETTPSVWVPLGDFFGTAPGINVYKSVPLGMSDNEFYSYWYMPFGRRAHIEFLNESKQPIALQVSLTHAPLIRPISTLGRFHAKWHRDALLPDPATGRTIDWTLLQTQGQGRFCGVMLHVWNPRSGWWGEGDEKFFVDGEKFPSTFGTGSEDYFGYAWSSPKLFYHALHNQTHSDPKTGNISDNRWHIADNIPFHTSFDGSIEKYFPNARPTLYAATTYWYLAPGGRDPYGPVPLEQRVGYYKPLTPLHLPGVTEGEALRIASKTGGNTSEQDMSGFNGQWSGFSQLWWREAKPGDKLTLIVPVANAGKYQLKTQLTKARDYGIVQLYLDDQKLGAPIDCYNPTVVPTGELPLGTVDLTAGEHKLTAEIVGANEKADKAYLFGLDYIKLEPAK